MDGVVDLAHVHPHPSHPMRKDRTAVHNSPIGNARDHHKMQVHRAPSERCLPCAAQAPGARRERTLVRHNGSERLGFSCVLAWCDAYLLVLWRGERLRVLGLLRLLLPCPLPFPYPFSMAVRPLLLLVLLLTWCNASASKTGEFYVVAALGQYI